MFEQVLARCIAEGAVGGEAFAVDASIIRADANRQQGGPGADGLPPEVMHRRAVQEYIATLDEAAFGGATGVVQKFLSPVDPAARWTRTRNDSSAQYSYAVNYLIDCENAVIMDVEATAAIRTAEVHSTRVMLDRVTARNDIKPKRLSGDTAYGSAEMLGWLVNERSIEPHIPVWDKTTRKDGLFERSDFTYDPEQDRYICPLKPKCCPKLPQRRVQRSIHEDARDVARQITASDAYLISRCERKKVEMLFAHLKRILKLDRLRLRGPNGAKDEFLLAATAQNLRKLAKLSIQGVITAAA